MSNNYSLESVLKLRSKVEESRLEIMSKSLQNYQINFEKSNLLEQKIDCFQYESVDMVDAVIHKNRYFYLEKMRNDLEEQKKNTVLAMMIYEKDRKEYVGAQMNRKVIEKHKEGYMEKLKYKLKQIESNMNNELAITNFNRRCSYK